MRGADWDVVLTPSASHPRTCSQVRASEGLESRIWKAIASQQCGACEGICVSIGRAGSKEPSVSTSSAPHHTKRQRSFACAALRRSASLPLEAQLRGERGGKGCGLRSSFGRLLAIGARGARLRAQLGPVVSVSCVADVVLLREGR